MTAVRTVLVTGAASGIGLGIARQFAADGHRLILVDRDPSVQGLARAMAASDTTARAFIVDLAEEAQILSMTDQVKEHYGGCDVLINCAGVASKRDGGPIALVDVSTADWDRVIRINLTAPFILCREFLPGMQARGFGRVVNITSVAGRAFRPRAGYDYCASKAGLIGLTRRLAGEYAPYGITVNCVAPGRVQTPMSGMSDSQAQAIAQSTIPMKRGGRVEEIAAAVSFLASDASAFTTGACLDVNGGDLIL